MKTIIEYLTIALLISIISIANAAETETVGGASFEDRLADIEIYFHNNFGITLENVFWGEFHAHTSYSLISVVCGLQNNQTVLNPAEAYAYARDIQNFDFIALNDNAELPNATAIPPEYRRYSTNSWQNLLLLNQHYNNEDERRGKVFIVFPGWEYSNTHGSMGLMGSTTGYGHKNVIFKHLNPRNLPRNRISAWPLFTTGSSLNSAATETDLREQLNPLFYNNGATVDIWELLNPFNYYNEVINDFWELLNPLLYIGNYREQLTSFTYRDSTGDMRGLLSSSLNLNGSIGYLSDWLNISRYYAETAENLWAQLGRYRPAMGQEEGTALTIIHTPSMIGTARSLNTYGGGQDHRTDWNVMDRDFVRHVEICSQWGSSEGRVVQTSNNGNPEGYYQYSPGPQDVISVRNILYEKWVKNGDESYILGFLGGTDNHFGKAGSTIPSCEMKYQGTVTGIIAPRLTRNNLWSSMWRRHTLACSTSPSTKRYPIILAAETSNTDLMMGDIGYHNGNVRLRALVCPDLGPVELIIDGQVVQTFERHDIDEYIELPPGRHFIYLRATFVENGEKGMAWTSPVYFK